MRKVSSIFLAGCIFWGTISVHPSGKVAEAQSVASQVKFLNGTWEGSYLCTQGLTKLKLVIDAKSTTDIDAVFLFSEHSNNPGVPTGRFRMKGNLEVFDSPDIPNLLDLKATSWINQPSGYGTVDLRGDVSVSNRRITGNVVTRGCSTFDVVKREFNINSCNSVLAEAAAEIDSKKSISVFRSETRSHEYAQYPLSRNNGHFFVLDGTGAMNIMNSPVSMKAISTRIINSCNNIGLVEFALYKTDWGITFGMLNHRKIDKFSCRNLGREEGLYPLNWGQRFCP